MAKLIVAGTEYEVPDDFDFEELGLIKRMSGYRGQEMLDAMREGDFDVLGALVVICKRRAGEQFGPDDVKKLKMSDFDVKNDEPEAEPGPPARSRARAAK